MMSVTCVPALPPERSASSKTPLKAGGPAAAIAVSQILSASPQMVLDQFLAGRKVVQIPVSNPTAIRAWVQRSVYSQMRDFLLFFENKELWQSSLKLCADIERKLGNKDLLVATLRKRAYVLQSCIDSPRLRDNMAWNKKIPELMDDLLSLAEERGTLGDYAGAQTTFQFLLRHPLGKILDSRLLVASINNLMQMNNIPEAERTLSKLESFVSRLIRNAQVDDYTKIESLCQLALCQRGIGAVPKARETLTTAEVIWENISNLTAGRQAVLPESKVKDPRTEGFGDHHPLSIIQNFCELVSSRELEFLGLKHQYFLLDASITLLENLDGHTKTMGLILSVLPFLSTRLGEELSKNDKLLNLVDLRGKTIKLIQDFCFDDKLRLNLIHRVMQLTRDILQDPKKAFEVGQIITYYLIASMKPEFHTDSITADRKKYVEYKNITTFRLLRSAALDAVGPEVTLSLECLQVVEKMIFSKDPADALAALANARELIDDKPRNQLPPDLCPRAEVKLEVAKDQSQQDDLVSLESEVQKAEGASEQIRAYAYLWKAQAKAGDHHKAKESFHRAWSLLGAFSEHHFTNKTLIELTGILVRCGIEIGDFEQSNRVLQLTTAYFETQGGYDYLDDELLQMLISIQLALGQKQVIEKMMKNIKYPYDLGNALMFLALEEAKIGQFHGADKTLARLFTTQDKKARDDVDSKFRVSDDLEFSDNLNYSRIKYLHAVAMQIL
ncbi:MAG: hypothetical protein WCF65_02955 [Parachlamydiaceae bacterium]